ncbi:hypothetical protein JNJ66_02075 [Candidatus Saccharibacteria bacterium]|nr:hypothetical protein [Candidatus Saccharibacteria bacterium]
MDLFKFNFNLGSGAESIFFGALCYIGFLYLLAIFVNRMPAIVRRLPFHKIDDQTLSVARGILLGYFFLMLAAAPLYGIFALFFIVTGIIGYLR